MLVVIDTNIWRSELALNSLRGTAVRFYLRQQGATLVVPEVVRLGLRENLTSYLRDLVRQIQDCHQQLLPMFGELKEVALPTDVQIQERVVAILSELDVPIREVPFTLESARSSFIRTIEKTPPVHPGQQFKDGVIWSDCLGLLSEDDVYLVTADKNFYQDKDYSKGLAEVLIDEVKNTDHRLHLLSDLDELLEGIRVDVKIDPNPLVDLLLERYADSYDQMLEAQGFALGSDRSTEMKLFATESASRMYVEFVVTLDCADSRGESRSAVLRFAGNGSYDIDSQSFVGARLEHETLEWVDGEGAHQSRSVWAAVRGLTIGHASVRHTMKIPLH
ncbi:MAG: PIN domain-containing protein [Thermodesulfobacteriota bacterium]